MSTEEDRESFIRSYLTEEEISRMVSEARNAVKSAKPTYSQFYVGACILTHEGDYITGCNIENISYTQSVHAEGCAISKAISMNKSNYKAIAVYAKSENFTSFVPPCGECRQFLNEFVSFLPIIMVHETGCLMFEMLHEILPLSVVLGATVPIANKHASKYDLILFKANNWIMKDIYNVTRNQMRKLLRDWKFDEISRLTGSNIEFNENGVVQGEFFAGNININFFTVQRLFEGMAVALNGSKNKMFVFYNDDKHSEFISHRIVATLLSYNFTVDLAKNTQETLEKSKEDGYIISVSSDEVQGKRLYKIKISGSDTLKVGKDIIDEIHKKRNELITSRFLNEFYDYNKNTLIKRDI